MFINRRIFATSEAEVVKPKRQRNDKPYSKKFDNFIQSSGIFSEGVAGNNFRRTGRYNGDRKSDKENEAAVKIMSIPVVKKMNWEVNINTFLYLS